MFVFGVDEFLHFGKIFSSDFYDSESDTEFINTHSTQDDVCGCGEDISSMFRNFSMNKISIFHQPEKENRKNLFNFLSTFWSFRKSRCVRCASLLDQAGFAYEVSRFSIFTPSKNLV